MKQAIFFFLTIISTALLFYGQRQYQKRDKKKSLLQKLFNELQNNYKIAAEKQEWTEYYLQCQGDVVFIKDYLGNTLSEKIAELYISLKSTNSKILRVTNGNWSKELCKLYYENIGIEIKEILDELKLNNKIIKT